MTNSPGANLDSEAGPEGVTYREVGHSAPGIGAYELAVPIKDRLLENGEVAERLTNSPGANLDSEAGPEGVTYREVGHSAPGIGAYELAVPIKDRLLENGEVAERLNAPVLKTGKG